LASFRTSAWELKRNSNKNDLIRIGFPNGLIVHVVLPSAFVMDQWEILHSVIEIRRIPRIEVQQ
tara:strand:+ start:500 stop:691 length:192 start_codon:yes stop_codon:yes gene_type:complete